MYKPSELMPFLNQLGIYPKKGLSQNFLIDGNIIQKILSSSEVKQGDIVLEIGPGPGSLTQALLEKEASVIAVEKDQILSDALSRFQTPKNNLVIFNEDIMTFDMEKEFGKRLQSGQKGKVIANLPYHLTTPILSKLIPMNHLFSSITVMVQDEVARRMTANPNTSEYSSLTLFLQFYSNPYYAFHVSRNCFYPAPKVDSAVVVLPLHSPPLDDKEAESFFKITRTAFEHRRKMLRASLKNLFSPKVIEETLVKIGQNPLARPEVLSLEEFLKLYELLHEDSLI